MTDSTVMRRRASEALQSVADHVTERLQKDHKLSIDAAADIGNDLADWMADFLGGQLIYFARGKSREISTRDLQIFERMKRGNANELAAEFGISYVQVYSIYRRMLREARKARQPGLFKDEDEK